MHYRLVAPSAVLLSVLLIPSAAGENTDALDQFLDRPDRENLSHLGVVANIHPGSLDPRDDRLLDLVRGGNFYAAKFLAENVKHLDGADSEEALKALGESATGIWTHFSIWLMMDFLAGKIWIGRFPALRTRW